MTLSDTEDDDKASPETDTLIVIREGNRYRFNLTSLYM